MRDQGDDDDNNNDDDNDAGPRGGWRPTTWRTTYRAPGRRGSSTCGAVLQSLCSVCENDLYDDHPGSRFCVTTRPDPGCY